MLWSIRNRQDCRAQKAQAELWCWNWIIKWSMQWTCWWKHNIKNSFQDLVIPKPDITIFTDANETGWGITDGHNPSGGQWAEHERIHINVLELKAAFIEILTYCHNRSYKHIDLFQTVLQQLHILIIKVVLSPKKPVKLQKK